MKMKETEKKKKNGGQLLVMLMFMAIGAAAGLVMAKFMLEGLAEGETLLDRLPVIAVLFVGLYVIMFAHIALHEAGHLLFGLLTGYGFSSFRVGSLVLAKESGKLRLRSLSVAGTGGQCLMTPPDMVDGKIPYVLYNLGGIAVNIVLGVISLVVALQLEQNSLWRMLLMINTAVGIGFALVNGLPIKLGGVNNDGHNAMSLGKDPDALRAFWVQMKINQQTAEGQRLKDLPADWFAVPEDEKLENPMLASLAVFATNRYMDEKNFEAGAALMEKLLGSENGMIGVHRNLMICDAAYCELIGQNRPEKLTNFLSKEQKQFMKAMKNFPTVLRTEYVYAILGENDAEKAEKIRIQFEKVAKKYPYPGDVQSERELMELAAACAEERTK